MKRNKLVLFLLKIYFPKSTRVCTSVNPNQTLHDSENSKKILTRDRYVIKIMTL